MGRAVKAPKAREKRGRSKPIADTTAAVSALQAQSDSG